MTRIQWYYMTLKARRKGLFDTQPWLYGYFRFWDTVIHFKEAAQ